MSRPKIGLALGSGAARGWAHIGIVDALLEADIVPEIVCGTSIGALVGAAYVTGKLDALRERVEAFGRRDVVALVDVRFSGGGLIEGKRIGAFLHANQKTLHKLGIGVSEFGEKTFLVDALPPYFPTANLAQTFRDIIDELRQTGEEIHSRRLLEIGKKIKKLSHVFLVHDDVVG